jgi:hypothetical protein
MTKEQVILCASLAEDIEDAKQLHAFGELTYAELLDIQSKLEYRIDLVIGGQVW